MWLAERREQKREAGESCAGVGPVTVPEFPLAVWLEGERRGVVLYGPAGYYWRPERDQKLLVLKTDGDRYCAVGASQEERPKLKEGQILIRTGKAGILLDPRGTVQILGKLIQGQENQ